jgi:ATP-dependent exoDNAse (exonuclease V) alpha subunit
LLLAPTGIAAMNIGGLTIHSALRIASADGNSGRSKTFTTLLWNDPERQQEMRRINTIIIDEVSMVESDLLMFVSDIFGRLHNTHRPFGNVNVILIGDLFQLPPVTGSAVFHAPVWRLFYPLILSTSHRQGDDYQFFRMLEELRLGNPSQTTIQALVNKQQEFTPRISSFNTTHIGGYRRHVDRLNQVITSSLPSTDSFVAEALDHINNIPTEIHESSRLFKGHTNLPDRLLIAIGARVMFLDNSLFRSGICNGTIGVILSVNNDESVKVAFPTSGGIQEVNVYRTPQHFYVNGSCAVRRQYPLQNSFALTVHKTQGLTLPSIYLELDETMFTCGQAYVAISRAKCWEDISIMSFRADAFRVNFTVVREYERLKSIAEKHNIYDWQASNRSHS